MRTVDKRDIKHITQRRDEASRCLSHNFFHAAGLAAGSGIELLVEFLFYKLLNDLSNRSARKAKTLQNELSKEETKNNAKTKYWGLRNWLVFMKKQQILERLCSDFNFTFRTLSYNTLEASNETWNKLKHDFYEATLNDANELVYFLNEYLIEIEINLEEDHKQRLTVGDISKHWLGQWEKPLASWVAQNQTTPQTEILLYLTPLLDLVIRLIDDKRIYFEHKAALMVAANYVFSSLDLVPEDTDKQDVHRLVDDGAVLALTVYWLLQHEQFDQAIVSDHWTGGASVFSEAKALKQNIYDNQEILFPDSRKQLGYRLAWNVIARITEDGPEALWQNYWKEAY